jgi:hypothetical protein
MNIMYKKSVYIIFVSLILGMASNPAAAELVAYYPMNEGSGTLVNDASGNGHDGQLTGTSPEWVSSQSGLGTALWFPGATNPQSIVDTGIWNPSANTGRLSVAAWIKWDGLNGFYQGIVSKNINWSDLGTYWNLELHPNTGNIGFGQFGDYKWFGMNIPLVNEWQHIAVTFDGATAILYLDGQNVGTTDFSFGLAENAPVVIGAGYADGQNPFNGTIDEVRLYDHVLSEFDLHAIAVTNYGQAWKPNPADGQVDVTFDRKLSWNPGFISNETFELYNEHRLYFVTDFNDVNSATVPTEIFTDINEYTPELDYNTTYFWRVDQSSSLEPNSLVKGKVWSFKSANFIVVDDFENYDDYPPNEVFMTWVDGWDDPSNGSTAGHPSPDFVGGKHYVEDEFVHGDHFSFPLYYDNSAGLSEVTRSINADWTVDDVIALTLFYYGDAANAIEPMYVALNSNAVIFNDNARAALDNEWKRWNIQIQYFANMGVDLTNVNSMSIGFGNKDNPTPGGSGLVFFDDIRLYRPPLTEVKPEPEAVDPGTENVVAHYDFENDFQDSSGYSQHATAYINPKFVSGPTGFGSAITLNGISQYIELPIGQVLSTLHDCTIATWVNWSGLGETWQHIFDFGSGETVYMFLTSNNGSGYLSFAMTTSGFAGEDQITYPGILPSRWHHVAVTIDSNNTTHTLYIDGKVVAKNNNARHTPSDLGVTTQNWLGRAQYMADPFFNGSLDEFYIYDRVLSDTELFYLMGR